MTKVQTASGGRTFRDLGRTQSQIDRVVVSALSSLVEPHLALIECCGHNVVASINTVSLPGAEWKMVTDG